jgi:cell division protein ZapA (FtsZ GTPase activity inhibitor)
MDETLSINVTIADRRYPMKIHRHEEEKIRKAVKVLNERILQYQQRFKVKDQQDLLAMTALQFVIQNIDWAHQSELNPMMQQINDLNDELRSFLDQ